LSARRAGASSGGVQRRSLAAACGRQAGERGREERSRRSAGCEAACDVEDFRAVCGVCVAMYRFCCQLADRLGWRKTAVLDLFENGTVDQKSASVGRWSVFVW
jgi:hypothetical protein